MILNQTYGFTTPDGGRSASERYGRRYRADDEWFRGHLGLYIRNWSRPRRRIERLQRYRRWHFALGIFIPFGPEYAAF